MQKLQGIATRGGEQITTSGVLSSTESSETFPLCTLSVYATGTSNLSSIYSDSSLTPKANPFTVGSDASWSFYAVDGHYDLTFSGTGITVPFTISDIVIGGAFVTPGVFTNTQMNLLLTANVHGINFKSQFQYTNGNNYSTDAITGGVLVPSGATVWQANGVSGFVADGSGGTLHASVGGQFVGTAVSNNVNVFGSNIVAQDIPALTTGISLTGAEIIAGPQNAPSVYEGTTALALTLGGSYYDAGTVAGNTYGSAMLSIATSGIGSSGGGNIFQRYASLGIQINDYAINGPGIRFGAKASATTTADSTAILFQGRNAGAPMQSSIYGDKDGNIVLLPNAAGAVQAICPFVVKPTVNANEVVKMTFLNSEDGQLDLKSNGNTTIQFNADSPSFITTRTGTGNAAKLGIGTTSPATSAALDITSTIGALLLSRMTSTQRDALTAVNGMVIYNTTTAKFQGYEAGAWVNLI